MLEKQAGPVCALQPATAICVEGARLDQEKIVCHRVQSAYLAPDIVQSIHNAVLPRKAASQRSSGTLTSQAARLLTTQGLQERGSPVVCEQGPAERLGCAAGGAGRHAIPGCPGQLRLLLTLQADASRLLVGRQGQRLQGEHVAHHH